VGGFISASGPCHQATEWLAKYVSPGRPAITPPPAFFGLRACGIGGGDVKHRKWLENIRAMNTRRYLGHIRAPADALMRVSEASPFVSGFGTG